MENRLKQIREKLELSQESLGNRIKIKRSHVSSLENGTRNITERLITDICREFNVNENWLRTGEGDMFIESDEISLDEFARKKNLTSLEYDIIKSFINMEPDIRHYIIDNFKEIFKKHDNDEDEQVADVEPDNPWKAETDRVQAALDQQKAMDAKYNNPTKKEKLLS